jgi:hypothetical protein
MLSNRLQVLVRYAADNMIERNDPHEMLSFLHFQLGEGDLHDLVQGTDAEKPYSDWLTRNG